MNGRVYELDWFFKNIHFHEKNRDADTPTEQRLECNNETNQQDFGNWRTC